MQEKQLEQDPQLDTDLLTALTSGRKVGDGCSFGLLLDSLEPDQRNAIQQALDDPSVGANTISNVLRDRDIGIVHHDTIKNHRKGTCRCVK